jgi:hypothetical protein
MSEVGDEGVIAWDAALWRSRSRNRTFMLPDAMSERLDALVRLLDDSGVRVTRAEIVGAMLFAAKTDADELDRLVRSFKQATVADAYIGERQGPGLQLGPTHPGPRKREGS